MLLNTIINKLRIKPGPIGIHVGLHHLNAIQIFLINKRWTIGRCLRARFNRDDFEGSLLLILQSLRQEYLGSAPHISLILPADLLTTTQLQMPVMSKHDLSGALKLKLKLSDATIFDFITLPKTTESDGLQTVLCFMMPADKMHGILKVCKQVGYVVDEILPVPLLQHRAYQMAGETAPIAYVDISADATTVSICNAEGLLCARTFPIGGDTFTKSLVGNYSAEGQFLELNLEQAEAYKKKYGVKLNSRDFPHAQLSGMIRETLEKLLVEINRTFQYYYGSLKGAKIARLSLSGGGSILKNLEQFLANNLQVPVVGLDWSEITPSILNLDKYQYQLLSNAIAGAIAPTNSIHTQLLPREYLNDLIFKKLKLGAIALSVFVIGSLLIWGFSFVLDSNIQQKRNLSLKQQVWTLSAVASKFEQINIERKMLAEKRHFLENFVKKNLPVSNLIKELSNILPAYVQLHELSAYQVDSQNKLSLRATVWGEANMAEVNMANLIETLEKSPYIENVTLASYSRNDSYNLPALDISLWSWISD